MGMVGGRGSGVEGIDTSDNLSFLARQRGEHKDSRFDKVLLLEVARYCPLRQYSPMDGADLALAEKRLNRPCRMRYHRWLQMQ
jgi:hypothetical protein